MKPMTESKALVVFAGLMLFGLQACDRQPDSFDAGPSPARVESLPEVSTGPGLEMVEGLTQEVADIQGVALGPPGREAEPTPAQADEKGEAGIEFAFPHADREPVDHLALARQQLSGGDRAGAMLELEKALYDDPADFSAASLLGATARDAGRRELAVDAFMLAAQIDPDADDPWLQLARMSLDDGELQQAEQLARRALRLNPKRALAHNVLGRIWLKRSHWEPAIERFKKALQLSPTSIYYRNNLGFALLLKRDFQQAVEVLEPLAERDDVKAFMLNNLGLAYEGAGRLGEASTQFEGALEIRPRYVNAKVNLDRMVQLAQRSDDQVEPVPGGGEEVEPVEEPPGEDLLLPDDGSF